MKRIGIIVAFMLACGGAPQKVTITTPQEYENVVTQLIEEVIEIFRSAGINCEMLSHDLETIDRSPKLNAARDWKTAHPEAVEVANAKIEARRAEIEKAAAPGMRQCGASVEPVIGSLTQ
jgi:hypothetical protein